MCFHGIYQTLQKSTRACWFCFTVIRDENHLGLSKKCSPNAQNLKGVTARTDEKGNTLPGDGQSKNHLFFLIINPNVP